MKRGTQIAGARVLITGAGSGIGRLMALDAAARGAAEVLIWDLSAESGKRVADEIAATGSHARSFTVNVADSDQVALIAEDTGPVDVLVNCAGIVTGKKLLDADEDAIRRVYDVNVLALYWTTRAFLPGMLERDRGSVVTISSAAGFTGVAKQTDYSASKFAALGFTESLRNELRTDGSNIGTLVVCPFYINTGMFEGVTTKFPAFCPSSRRTTSPPMSSTPSNPGANSSSCPHWSACCRPCDYCRHGPSTECWTSSGSTRPWTTSPAAGPCLQSRTLLRRPPS